MNYNLVSTKEEAIAWIHGLIAFGIKPGLKRMEWMLERLDHPERRTKFIHVAGTNGKGSTISYISEILMAADYNVGIFTSPYLIEFTNRIKINRNDISGDELVECLNQLIPLAEALAKTELGSPTEFEVVTALAILYYSRQRDLDIVLWETGLGGRLDSTNVVQPLLTIITHIGYDHLNILGSSLSEIAAEKVGIIKNGAPLISGVLNPEAFSVIDRATQRADVKLYQLSVDFQATNALLSATGSTFDFRWALSKSELDQLLEDEHYWELQNLRIRMVGEHQVNNAAIAIAAIQVLNGLDTFSILEAAIRGGLLATSWGGRFEQLSSDPFVVIDGAHNPAGAKAVVDAVKLLEYGRLILVLGLLHDKPIEEFLQIILPIADDIIATEPAVPRRSHAGDLQQLIRTLDPTKSVTALADWEDALIEGLSRLEAGDLLLVAGSLYLISDARKFLLKKLDGACAK